nr:MAG TPA: hypothetical protein [Caudoviricetes sp.]DAZ46010.1 MAG TPA: hypothetical protein [Caudoviricetes sp.]
MENLQKIQQFRLSFSYRWSNATFPVYFVT